jgi:holo-[acyl-carrier protein] synthase
MILGIGTDIIEVERIKKSVSKRDFVLKVFTPNEIAYCERGQAEQHYAARFAAKEAFFKALGTGWAGEMEITDVEVMNDAFGKPGIQLTGNTAKYFSGIGGGTIHLSLSHLPGVAVAFVIIERKDDK